MVPAHVACAELHLAPTEIINISPSLQAIASYFHGEDHVLGHDNYAKMIVCFRMPYLLSSPLMGEQGLTLNDGSNRRKKLNAATLSQPQARRFLSVDCILLHPFDKAKSSHTVKAAQPQECGAKFVCTRKAVEAQTRMQPTSNFGLANIMTAKYNVRHRVVPLRTGSPYISEPQCVP